ncbi:MAG: hypothetical protein D6679_12400 [Candidatus Hydrogenedentota bacterium]|nr:MAG: hypothetical protein D6679_12400 [Candidatus Hydrogenedentota bacterium]
MRGRKDEKVNSESDIPVEIVPAKEFLKKGGSEYSWWIYADDDELIYEECRRRARSCRELFSIAERNEAVEALRDEFVVWADRGASEYGGLDCVLAPYSRDPSTRKLFHRITILWLLAQKLPEVRGGGVVVTDSPFLMRDLVKLCGMLERRSKISGRIEFGRQRVRSYWSGIRFLFVQFLSLTGMACFIPRFARKIMVERLSRCRLLVETFFMSRLQESYYERYYPGWKEAAEESGRRISWAILPFGWEFREWRRFFSSTVFLEDEIIIPIAFLGLSDFVRIVGRILRGGVARPRLRWFRDIDVTNSILESKIPSLGYGMVGLFAYYAWKNLLENKNAIHVFFDWYENQEWDKGTALAIQRLRPWIRTIGFRGYPPLRNWLSLYTTSQERKNLLAYREQWVVGKINTKEFARFDRELIFRVIPASRYRKEETNPKKGDATVRSKEQIAVFLSSDLQDTYTILTLLRNALFHLDLPAVLLKPHPGLPFSVLIRCGCDWRCGSNRVSPTSEPARDIFEKARFVVAGASSVVWEALLAGCFVCVVRPRVRIDLTTLPSHPLPQCRVVQSAEEFLKAWEAFQKWDGEKGEIPAELDDELEPVTAEGMKRIFQDI